MLIYLFLMVFIVICAIFAGNGFFSEKFYMRSFFCIFVLLSGFRYGIGSDYFSYQDVFYNITDDQYWIEPLFLWLNITLRDFGFEFQSLVFVCSFISCYFVFKFIDLQSPNKIISIILFLFMGFYFMSYNIIRQFVAVSIFLYSYNYFVNKKYVKCLLIHLLGIGFHYSLLLLTPVFFLSKLKLNKKILIYIWVISVFFIVINPIDVLNKLISLVPIFNVYHDSEYLNVNMLFKIKLLVPNIILFTILIRWNKLTKEYKLKDMVNIYVFFVIGFNFFSGVSIIMRLLVYFEIFSIVVIPHVLNLFQRDSKMFLLILVLLYYFTMTVGSVLILEQYQIVPYDYNYRLF